MASESSESFSSVSSMPSTLSSVSSSIQSTSTSAAPSTATTSNAFSFKELLKNFEAQLAAQNDVNSDYLLLQKKLNSTRNWGIGCIEDCMEKNLEPEEKKWNDLIDETIAVKKKLEKEVQRNAIFAFPKNKIQKEESEMRKEIQQKQKKLYKGAEEVKELAEALESFHAKTLLDKRRLEELEAKMKEIKKMDANMGELLEREHQISKLVKKAASQNEEKKKTHGVWELTTGYKQLLRLLGTTLDDLKELQAQSTKDSTPIPTLTKEELDILVVMLQRVNKMISDEISTPPPAAAEGPAKNNE